MTVDETLMPRAARRLLEAALGNVDPSDLDIARAASPGGGAHSILESAADADLVVVGSRGLGAVQRWLLGSVATQVLHHAPGPVAVIPAADGKESSTTIATLDRAHHRRDVAAEDVRMQRRRRAQRRRDRVKASASARPRHVVGARRSLSRRRRCRSPSAGRRAPDGASLEPRPVARHTTDERRPPTTSPPTRSMLHLLLLSEQLHCSLVGRTSMLANTDVHVTREAHVARQRRERILFVSSRCSGVCWGALKGARGGGRRVVLGPGVTDPKRR